MPEVATRPPEPSGGGAITIEQLIALNDEIAALARAGLPLERNLGAIGGDLPGRLGAITRALGARMARGEGLADALEAEGAGLPPAYRAAVEAGLRAGRLPVALEGLASFARTYAELRRAVGLALMYPLTVLALAYGLFVAFAAGIAPRFLRAFESFRLDQGLGPLAGLVRLGDSAAYWGPALPAALLLGLGVAWARSGGAAGLGRGRGRGLMRWVPWMGGMVGATRASAFADLLALLVEHRVPLPEGIELAAGASGDPAMEREGRALAADLRRGDTLGDGLRHAGSFPPLLRWLMVTGERQGRLADALRHAAETYRRRALARADAIRTVLPTVLMLAIGATATLVYALTLFIPFSTLLNDLSLDS